LGTDAVDKGEIATAEASAAMMFGANPSNAAANSKIPTLNEFSAGLCGAVQGMGFMEMFDASFSGLNVAPDSSMMRALFMPTQAPQQQQLAPNVAPVVMAAVP
jgi:hypothetical protein